MWIPYGTTRIKSRRTKKERSILYPEVFQSKCNGTNKTESSRITNKFITSSSTIIYHKKLFIPKRCDLMLQGRAKCLGE